MKTWARRTFWTIGIIVVCIAILLGLSVIYKDNVAKVLIEMGGSWAIGAPVTVSKVYLDITPEKYLDFEIRNFRLHNPEGFPDEVLAHLPEISAVIDLPQLTKGKFHLPELTIDLAELIIVTRADGKTNIDSLKVIEESAAEEGQEKEKPKEQEQVSSESTMVDKLTLSIGKVTSKNYQKGEGDKPKISTINIDLNQQVFTGIPSVRQLVGVIIGQALMKTTIKTAKTAGIIAGGAATGGALLVAGFLFEKMDTGSLRGSFKEDLPQVYQACLKAAVETGTVTIADEKTGKIEISDADADKKIIIKVKQEPGKETKVDILAKQGKEEDHSTAKDILSSVTRQLKRAQ